MTSTDPRKKDADTYEHRTWEIIAHGGNGYNYYMAHGGSNFGYSNNDEDAASYDYGAAVGQGETSAPCITASKGLPGLHGVLKGYWKTASSDGCRPATPRRAHANGPAGTIYFVDNATDKPTTTCIGSDTVTVNPGEISPSSNVSN